MFGKIDADKIEVNVSGECLVFTYQLGKEDYAIKAAGRITLEKASHLNGEGCEWAIEEGGVLTVKVRSGDLGFSVGLVRKAFEEMIS